MNKLWPWQSECLNHTALINGKNFIYSLPTSGGKSLPADIMLLRAAVEFGKKALLVLPFVSMCVEKSASLEEFSAECNFIVESYWGGHGIFPLSKGPQVCICTIEKANVILNWCLEEDRLDEIHTVVIDEIHMIGDCLLYTSPSPRDRQKSRMPSSA